jgi:uncharacterized protein with GYD domain
MATHIIFFSFTQQGIEHVNEISSRIQKAKQIVQSFGGTVKDFYAIMGSANCDTMFVIDSPDNEAVAKAALKIAQDGNVRTTTVRAFNEQEFQGLISGLSP